jgi:hypothetical protein
MLTGEPDKNWMLLIVYAQKSIIWKSIYILDEFNPLAELEWRNQPAGLTDCLYLYRESAEFIMFADADDILTPRMDRYIDEFRFLLDRWPYVHINFILHNWSYEIMT